jgi:hypothetical protein
MPLSFFNERISKEDQIRRWFTACGSK